MRRFLLFLLPLAALVLSGQSAVMRISDRRDIAKPSVTALGQMPATKPRIMVAGAVQSTAPASASAASAGFLPAERNASANWQRAGLLSAGGIPNRTTLCATVPALGNGQDDTKNIQNAIDHCPAGQVVFLPAGAFTIAEGGYLLVNKSISLRGAGPGLTTLGRPNGARLGTYIPGSAPSPLVIMGPMRWNNETTSTLLTEDAAFGANSVQVGSTAGFSVGEIVYLDEASGAGWQHDAQGLGRIWAAPDYRVVWQKHDPAEGWDDFGATAYPDQAGSPGCWFSNCDRPTSEIKRISAISGNVITFDSPVTISYRVSHQAKLYYWRTPHTLYAGVENLTVANGDDGNVKFLWCAYCWAKNVENTRWLGDGFDINASFRVQLETVYIHHPVWPVPGGGGYNISLALGSSEILVQDSISLLTNKVMVARSAGAGSVIAYNYMDDGYINGQDGWVESGLNASHMVGSHHVLFEGNYAFNIDSDQTHGNAIYNTFFRNYITGYRRPFTALDGSHIDDTSGCCGPLRAASAHGYAYWFSFIGNVLGTPGRMEGWTYDSVGGRNVIPPPGIWMLGWFDISPQGYDPNVAATAIREGNFDYLTNAIHWTSNDGPHQLPPSLYLTSKPDFFGDAAWPWVTPDRLDQQVFTLPAKARYDSAYP